MGTKGSIPNTLVMTIGITCEYSYLPSCASSSGNYSKFFISLVLCAGKSLYALHPVSEVSPALPLKRFQCSNVRLIDDGPLSSFQGRSSSAFSFHACLLQAIDGVMSLALCPQVVSQASQHFRFSEKQATCEGCFALSFTIRKKKKCIITRTR